MQFGINKCSCLVVQGEVSRFLNSNPIFYLSSQELLKRILYLLRCTVFKWFRIETDHTENK